MSMIFCTLSKKIAWCAGQGIAALMALNSLELEEDLPGMGWGTGAHLHAAIESMRLAFADALAYNADPEVGCCLPLPS